LTIQLEGSLAIAGPGWQGQKAREERNDQANSDTLHAYLNEGRTIAAVQSSASDRF